jgi:hypothetical protein
LLVVLALLDPVSSATVSPWNPFHYPMGTTLSYLGIVNSVLYFVVQESPFVSSRFNIQQRMKLARNRNLPVLHPHA